jgi:hypothetical protein
MRKILLLLVVIAGAGVLAVIGWCLANPSDTGAKTQFILGVIAGLALIGSLWIVPDGWGKKLSDGGAIKKVQAGVLAAWVLLPPLYFWMEYFWLYKHLMPDGTRPEFEAFKYGQDVSSRVWIATTSTLGLLYFWNDLKRE